MKTRLYTNWIARLAGVTAAVAALAGTATAQMNHAVEGITGPNFDFTAKSGYITAGDGNSIYFWGYANTAPGASGIVQYSGPTMIVNQGDSVSVTLHNELPVPSSILFPGQSGVSASGGTLGLLTREAGANGANSVTYSFVADHPGTYMYHSGTRPDLQIEMGLVGAIIVRPAGFDPAVPALHKAYDDLDPDGAGPLRADSAFDQEYLFLLTEMDEKIHDTVEAQVLAGEPIVVDTTEYWPVYWFINGRNAPDTMLASGPAAPWLDHQPYNCMPMMHPGQRVLLRVIGAGRDPHPLHHHGNHSLMIAQDGRLLTSTPGTLASGADLAELHFTIPSFPGSTADSIFTWTGENLGWDMYGHKPADPLEPYEFATDHGKPIPTILPTEQHITYGQHYGGSPFLGTEGRLPPGEGGFNSGGFMYMWHSHNEKEIVNNDIFPGGMSTMMMIEAWPEGMGMMMP